MPILPDTHPPYSTFTLSLIELEILEDALPAWWSKEPPMLRAVAKQLQIRLQDARDALAAAVEDGEHA